MKFNQMVALLSFQMLFQNFNEPFIILKIFGFLLLSTFIFQLKALQ